MELFGWPSVDTENSVICPQPLRGDTNDPFSAEPGHTQSLILITTSCPSVIPIEAENDMIKDSNPP